MALRHAEHVTCLALDEPGQGTAARPRPRPRLPRPARPRAPWRVRPARALATDLPLHAPGDSRHDAAHWSVSRPWPVPLAMTAASASVAWTCARARRAISWAQPVCRQP